VALEQAGIVGAMTAGTVKLQVPRWIQVVLLPLALIAVWLFASAVRHAILVFLISAIIAVLLNPLVHRLTRLRLSRGLAVGFVYLSMAALVVGVTALIGTVVVNQGQSITRQIEGEFTVAPGASESPAELKVDRLQRWLDAHHLERIHVKQLGDQLVTNIREHGVSTWTQRALDVTQTVATTIVTGIINLILVIVVSIYMLLDAPRISRAVDRIFPPGPDGKRLGVQVQRGLISYVRGQAIVSLIIGVSAGLAIAVLGLVGVWPGAENYAFFFGAWATVTEIIPYIGPILGALPPIIVALIHDPLTAVWVALVFLAIHQLEGHVVVPRVMGSALGAHPLVIIFGVLAGTELWGIAGVLLALPLIAMGREVWIFLRQRVELEEWPRSGVGLVGAGLQLTLAPRPDPPRPAEPEAAEEGGSAPDDDELGRGGDARAAPGV